MSDVVAPSSIWTFTFFGSSVPLGGVGIARSHATFELFTTAWATASKKGAHADAPSQICARGPPVLLTRFVYVEPALAGLVPLGYLHFAPGSVGDPQP